MKKKGNSFPKRCENSYENSYKISKGNSKHAITWPAEGIF
jgi:hypothetical protein